MYVLVVYCRLTWVFRGALTALLAATLSHAAIPLVNVDALGVRLAKGFRINVYADEPMVPDIHSLTVDPMGRVVVSGPGYIKVLNDPRTNGAAASATLVASPSHAAEGMCFDGGILYAVADGALLRYFAGNAGDPPDLVIPLRDGEFGGHQVRQGPDGSLYVMAGPATGINRRHANTLNSPIHEAEGGVLLRLAQGGGDCEIIAQGFRNPHAFDFNWLGDMFTWDGDAEADARLPWYEPSRLYQVGYAQHHGWRMAGEQRSWRRPEYYPDTVVSLNAVGSAVPTGVINYRHYRFPTYFHNGLFLLDWAHGRVYFGALQPQGSGYTVKLELFMETIGTHAFAPSDIVVAPDGALLIASGGRKTHGAIFRIQYYGNDAQDREVEHLIYTDDLGLRVLMAPQPQTAWSRAAWVPLARQLGADSFGRVLVNEQAMTAVRVRAVEVLTEVFGGISEREARAASRALVPEVRARVAWSLGRQAGRSAPALLLALAQDHEPAVRRCALESLGDRFLDFDPFALLPAIEANLAHPDKRLRLAAAHLAALLPPASWNDLAADLKSANYDARLMGGLVELWRTPMATVHTNAIQTALDMWKTSSAEEVRLAAVRLIKLALGDAKLESPSGEAFADYEPALSLRGREALVARIRQTLREAFPSRAHDLDLEISRLLAMLEEDDPKTMERVTAMLTVGSSPGDDLHYLTVLARLRGPRPAEITLRTAAGLTGLGRKITGSPRPPGNQWEQRLTEVARQLGQRDPLLGVTLLAQSDFPTDENLPLLVCLTDPQQQRAAALFAAAWKRGVRFSWSEPLVELLALLPASQVFPAFRQQAGNPLVREAIILQLAARPELEDRERFLAGLESSQWQVVESSVNALLKLPMDDNFQNLTPVLRLLQRLCYEPPRVALRERVQKLLQYQSAQTIQIRETGPDGTRLRATYQPWLDWFSRTYPTLWDRARNSEVEQWDQWLAVFKRTEWLKGNVLAGEKVFTQRGCAVCHLGSGFVGPSLMDVTNRYSREDFFRKIIFPSRELNEQYRMHEVQTRRHGNFEGLVVYESAELLLLQINATSAVRLDKTDIVSNVVSTRSFMPPNLLKGLPPWELANLYSFFQ